MFFHEVHTVKVTEKLFNQIARGAMRAHVLADNGYQAGDIIIFNSIAGTGQAYEEIVTVTHKLKTQVVADGFCVLSFIRSSEIPAPMYDLFKEKVVDAREEKQRIEAALAETQKQLDRVQTLREVAQ